MVVAALPTDWLSTGQAARRMECSAKWVLILAKQGRLRSLRTALGFFIDPTSIDEYQRDRAGSPER